MASSTAAAFTPPTAALSVVVLSLLISFYYAARGAWPMLETMLASNQLLQAMVIPSAVGCVLYSLTVLWTTTVQKVKGKFYSTITMTNKVGKFVCVLFSFKGFFRVDFLSSLDFLSSHTHMRCGGGDVCYRMTTSPSCWTSLPSIA